jgi:hypothetical protein
VVALYADSSNKSRLQLTAKRFIGSSLFLKFATILAAGYFDYEAIKHLNNDALRMRNYSIGIGFILDLGVSVWSFSSSTNEINALRSQP